MRRLKVFESVTLNGYFAGPGGDLDWAYAHSTDPEFQRWVAGNASTSSTLLLGRVTYEMMAAWWSTPAAAQAAPEVAKGMNAAEKLVASRKSKKLSWASSRLLDGELVEAVRALKRQRGGDIVVLGSGSIVAQLAAANLVDAYQLVVKPVALGGGETLFQGVEAGVELRLTSARPFKDGNLVLDYVPAT